MRPIVRITPAQRTLAMVAHDLKNPLGVITLSATRALAGEEPNHAQQHFEVILRAARRMTKLVGDLLDVAALDDGALRTTPVSSDAAQIVHDAVLGIGPLAADAGVSVEEEVDDDLPEAWVDPDRIAQVLGNLLGNAVKFTPRGGTIRVRLTSTTEELVCSVSDDGVGIAPRDLPHVFDRFWRAREARCSGVGLGLAICKSLVELSGGRIEASSERGHGTTVEFTMPRTTPEPRESMVRARR